MDHENPQLTCPATGVEAAEWLGELGRDLQAARSCCCLRKVTTFWATEWGGKGGVSRAEAQKHPSMPSFEKSPRDNIGPKFLISVAFVPLVTFPGPPVQKDLWLLSKTSLTSLVPPASHTG